MKLAFAVKRIHPDDLRVIIAAIYHAGSNTIYQRRLSLNLADRLLAEADEFVDELKHTNPNPH